MPHVKRHNGFQRPFTNDQIMSWFAEPIAALFFYLIVSTFTFDEHRTALLAAFTTMLVVHLACWLRCSLPDPSEDKGWYWPCMREAQKETRYCSVCAKHVPGLDHHCTWLNTCIGRRQYPAFFALVTIGSAMYWFEAAVFISLLTGGSSPRVQAKAVEVLGSLTTFRVLVSLAAVFAGLLAIGLSVLFCFHMFLQTTGLGTYAWMIDSRNRKLERKREKAKKKAKRNAVDEEAPPPKKADGNCTRTNEESSGNGMDVVATV